MFLGYFHPFILPDDLLNHVAKLKKNPVGIWIEIQFNFITNYIYIYVVTLQTNLVRIGHTEHGKFLYLLCVYFQSP